MPWVLFWIWPVSLTVLWAVERHENRVEARNASRHLAPVDLDELDDLIAQIPLEDFALLAKDPVAWNAWAKSIWELRSAPDGVPLRPFDPVPHTYPRRHARHGSAHRLHRGF